MQRITNAAMVFGVGSMVLFPARAQAETATPDEMEVVCRNWVSYIVNQQGEWAGDANPEIVGVDEISVDGQVLGRCFSIAPQGHVVVPILKELPPVKAYSDECSLDASVNGGLPQLLRDVLSSRIELYIKVYGSLEARQAARGRVLLGREHREQWERLLAPPEQFKAQLPIGGDPTFRSTGPLLTTRWHQRAPYYNYTPIGDTGCGTGDCPGAKDPATWTKVGCVATAAAQIMKYHNNQNGWPPAGIGYAEPNDYSWDGDDSCPPACTTVADCPALWTICDTDKGECAGCDPCYDAQTLSAPLYDTYQWADMLDQYIWDSVDNRWEDGSGNPCTDGQLHAVAELSYEVGVAYRMDYGVCVSWSSVDRDIEQPPDPPPPPLVKYFAYQDTIEKVGRNPSTRTPAEWFSLIQAEIDFGRPMAYRVKGHAIVCDGARVADGKDEYHMNYGWGDSHTTWYEIDKLHCKGEPNDLCPPSEEYLLRYIQPRPAPTWIIDQPDPLAVCEPAPATFCVIANGVGTLSYQWRKYLANIPGATSDCYIISPTDPTHAGAYSVVVTSTYDSTTYSVDSTNPALTVNTPVAITQDPQDETKCEGESVSFSVTATGTPVPSYQWFHGGTLIFGATNNVYSIGSVSTTDAGDYHVKVINMCNFVDSAPATLTVNTAPTITQQPQSQTVCKGDPVTFSVVATGTPAPSYQWRKGGQDIQGATSSTYTISSVSTTDAGLYDVVVTNVCSPLFPVPSSSAALAVNTLTITVDPQPETKCEGQSVTFSVESTGTAGPSYQWRKDGQDIDGATAKLYTIDPVLPTHAGLYDVVVTRGVCVADSGTAQLTVTTPVTITGHPQSQPICVDDPVTFTVTATGPDLTYQWRKGSADIYGATADSYTIAEVTLDDASEYDVVVSSGPCFTTSNPATLTVQTPAEIEVGGQPQDEEVCEGDSVTFTVTATGTPPPSYQWFFNDNLIPGAQADSYTIYPVTPDHAGVYFAVVSNVCNSPVGVRSDDATLTVLRVEITLPDSDYPDIQSAIDGVCDGRIHQYSGTVILSDPRYSGPGNRDLDYGGKAITVRSQSGDPEDCIIDCGGTFADPHRGFHFHSDEGPGSVLEGVTITNGYDRWEGGGILIDHCSPDIRACVFSDNTARQRGGAVAAYGFDGLLQMCVFSGNSVDDPQYAETGGGMYCYEGEPHLVGCTFYGNSAPIGGGLYADEYCIASLDNTIIAFGTQGGAVDCFIDRPEPPPWPRNGHAWLTCSGVYGNVGGDYSSWCLWGQNLPTSGRNNISADPLFCDPQNEDFTLFNDSPCWHENSPDDCGLIGARGVGCGVEPPQLPSDPQHQARKNRYISIDPTSNGSSSVAIEVALSSMKRCNGDLRRACKVDADCPGVCQNHHDYQCTTAQNCVNMGVGGICIPTHPCTEHPDVGQVTKWVDVPFVSSCVPQFDCAGQWFAHLADNPVYRVWTEDTLHITDCEIVPVAMYELRATTDGTIFGDPLTVGTIEKPHVHYGDCVGSGAGYTPPDGYTNVVDVLAYLVAFQGLPWNGHTTWVDLEGLATGQGVNVPQQILNVSDLQRIQFGFKGYTYQETPQQEDPGNCPP